MDLCLALGYSSPRKLLSELTSEEVTYWQAYYALRPWGYVRESELFGTIVAQQYNMHRAKNAKAQAWFDVFPPMLRLKTADGRDTNDNVIKLFQEYNLERGFSPDGRRKA